MFRYGLSSLLIIASLLIGIFYLKPTWDEFQAARTETEHLRALSSEFDVLIQNRDSLVTKLNLVSKDDLRRLDTLIPQGAHSLDYLIALQQLARERGVGLIFTRADINPPLNSLIGADQKRPSPIPPPTQQPRVMSPEGVAEARTAIRDLPVSIQITGSYDQLKQFVGVLEAFGRLTDIVSLSFSPQAGASAYSFSLGLVTHYQ